MRIQGEPAAGLLAPAVHRSHLTEVSRARLPDAPKGSIRRLIDPKQLDLPIGLRLPSPLATLSESPLPARPSATFVVNASRTLAHSHPDRVASRRRVVDYVAGRGRALTSLLAMLAGLLVPPHHVLALPVLARSDLRHTRHALPRSRDGACEGPARHSRPSRTRLAQPPPPRRRHRTLFAPRLWVRQLGLRRLTSSPSPRASAQSPSELNVDG